MSLRDLPLPALLERVSSSDPTPGGGSMSALLGAVAAALAAMVAGLTLSKAGLEAAHAESREVASRAAELERALLEAIDRDAASFDAVMAAMALPKATDSEKAERKAAMQRAFQGATDVPLESAGLALEAARLGARMLEIGNPNAATDAGVAVLAAVAGAEGALFNVAINLGSIQDAAFVAERREKARAVARGLAECRDRLRAGLEKAGVETF